MQDLQKGELLDLRYSVRSIFIEDLRSDIPDERIEGIWRQVLDTFRGGILADW